MYMFSAPRLCLNFAQMTAAYYYNSTVPNNFALTAKLIYTKKLKYCLRRMNLYSSVPLKEDLKLL